jgi:hypothetical protein
MGQTAMIAASNYIAETAKSDGCRNGASWRHGARNNLAPDNPSPDLLVIRNVTD